MIECSNRLQEIIEWIEGNVLADIGCDHAYVACQAVLSNKVTKSYACDIAEGPLEHAKETIQSEHLEGKVIPILMNGMEKLPEDVDICVIAGMGASTILDILEHAPLHTGLKLILSPHKDVENLRIHLKDYSISIQREKMVYDEGHYYPILDCIVKDEIQTLTIQEAFLGRNVVPNIVYSRFLKYEKDKLNKILSNMPEGKRDDLREKAEILKNTH